MRRYQSQQQKADQNNKPITAEVNTETDVGPTTTLVHPRLDWTGARTGTYYTENGDLQWNQQGASDSLDSVNSKHHSKISISVESLNCKGFRQSSDYIFERLASCDIMCLSENWLRPQEQSLIETSLKRNALMTTLVARISKRFTVSQLLVTVDSCLIPVHSGVMRRGNWNTETFSLRNFNVSQHWTCCI